MEGTQATPPLLNLGGPSTVYRSRQLQLQTRINPVLVALLLLWSADGALAKPKPDLAPKPQEAGATGKDAAATSPADTLNAPAAGDPSSLFDFSGSKAGGGAAFGGSEGPNLTPFLVVGAMAAGFAATQALLLGGSDRSYTRRVSTTPGGGPSGVPPQQPGAPGGSDNPAENPLPDPAGSGDPSDPGAPGGSGDPGSEAPPTIPAHPTSQPPTHEAPEPGFWLLLGSGAAAIFASRRRSDG